MRALLLISGGIDSPVAGYLMKKKLNLIGIHFNNYPFTGKQELEKTKQLCKKIGIKNLYVVNHGDFQTEILKKANRKFQCILCRRMMFRISEEIAKKENCKFFVSGENIGQVASQTLENLETTDSVTKLNILRPLLTYDKNEIIEISKKIGTYEISTLPGVCCTAVPKFPATKSKIEQLKREEEKLNIKEITKKAIKSAQLLSTK